MLRRERELARVEMWWRVASEMEVELRSNSSKEGKEVEKGRGTNEASPVAVWPKLSCLRVIRGLGGVEILEQWERLRELRLEREERGLMEEFWRFLKPPKFNSTRQGRRDGSASKVSPSTPERSKLRLIILDRVC